MEMKFYKCRHCGNIVAVVKASGAPISCCGEQMTEIIPGTTDAAAEKHVPVFEVRDNIAVITVGEGAHPMAPEHYIDEPGDEPKVCFALCEGEKLEAVYAYCNLHGLWKA